MSLEKALESAADRLSKGESHTEVARNLVKDHGLNPADLASVLKQSINKAGDSGGKKRKKSAAMAVQSSDTYVEDATYLASLLVSAIPGVTPTDVATALKDPRNYPNLTAYQMGEVLKSDGVFPSITDDDMQTALLAAGYPSADVTVAIAELYPVTPPPVTVTYRRMGPAGQTGQMPFDDNSYAIAGQPITQLIVRNGNIIDNLQAFYGTPPNEAPAHGGTGGGQAVIAIPNGDVLVEVSGYTGYWFGANYVLQLSFKTRNGLSFGPYANMGYSSNQTPFSFRVESNEQITGFFGSATYGDNGQLTLLGSLGIIIQTN